MDAERVEREAAAAATVQKAEAEKREGARRNSRRSAPTLTQNPRPRKTRRSRAAEIEAALTGALTEQEANWTEAGRHRRPAATAQQSLLDQVLAVLARETAAEEKAMSDARAAIAAVKA